MVEVVGQRLMGPAMNPDKRAEKGMDLPSHWSFNLPANERLLKLSLQLVIILTEKEN